MAWYHIFKSEEALIEEGVATSYNELLTADWQSCNERLAQNLSTEDEAQALRYRECVEQQMCGLGLMVESERKGLK